ncbi:MAG TPA: UvrD-helicase domain-containing protein [Pseudoxanthomonas sp.]
MSAVSHRDLAFGLPLSGVHLVEASAGTGKTFALTAWVLRLLLETGVPLPNLLAVTFTRAATAELRERVRVRLRIAKQVLAGEEVDGPEAEQTRALIDLARNKGLDDATLHLRLQAALLQLDEAAISTIHGFCQRALREFGFLAGALNNDELLDNANELWSVVAADLWRVASNGASGEFDFLTGLWSKPDDLARDLQKLCDPARKLLPEADESDVAAWLHRLRDDATIRFAGLLDDRHQRTQDQLIGQVWQASAQPRFAAALKKRWPLMLVDEFQDTDPRQWEIFRRVYEAEVDVENAVAPGLFLIGDPKQAIYRFRGGDLPTYVEARKYARKHGGEATLTINYRSRPAVLAGIEALFGESDAPFVDAGIDFIHVEPADRNLDATLKIDNETQPGVTVHWLPPDKPNASAQSQTLSVQATIDEIVRLLEGGTISNAKGERRLRPSDIAVLVRKNNQAEEIRNALACAGVAAAMQSSQSVFSSEAAGELLCLLHAFATPSDPARARAASATRLLRKSARDIAALDADPEAMQQDQQLFEQAGLAWRQRGPLPALLPFLAGHSSELLREVGGARLLTDALHLAELLQAESPSQHGINGLLRWFTRQWSDEENRDELALRMESDAQAVQVMTLHKSKGLEFPVVFLPFTAFAGGAGSRSALKKTLAHEGDGAAIYFHVEKDDIVLRAKLRHEALLEDEERDAQAEDLRLFYVGLTRAKFAVHLTGGCTRTQDFNASPLKWLLFGRQKAGSDAKAGEVRTVVMVEQARSRLIGLAASSEDGLLLRDVPLELPATILHARDEVETTPVAREAKRHLRAGGGQYSFSGLRARHSETLPARGADDEVVVASIESDGAVLRGPDFGNAVHDALEAANFAQWRSMSTAPAQAAESVKQALKRRGLPQTPAAQAQVATLVARALNVPLPGIGTLAELDPAQRIAEMEFHFRLAATRLPELFALLGQHGYPRHHAQLRQGEIEGLMHGYIDLVYRDGDGCHYVLDYKTNQLRSYTPAACDEAVRGNDYDLQYLIYLVALQRWLRLRFGADYDPARHLGGAVYLFLRGLEPEDGEAATAGIHRDRPPHALIDALDRLFDGGAA